MSLILQTKNWRFRMDNQRLDNQIEITGSIRPSVAGEKSPDLQEVYDNLSNFNFEELKSLVIRINSSSPISIIPEKLSIVEFEMLEAELRNQGILQKTPEKISQNISREISQLKWSVRHHLKSDDQIEFYINVPKYIYRKTVANIEKLSDNQTQQDDTIIQELRYLEQLATYLNGAYEEVDTAYERGLNLILRTVRSGMNLTASEISSKIEVIYPLDRKALLKEIFKIE